MNVFDPVATPARRNLAALLLASHNETIRFQLRRSPITADLVNRSRYDRTHREFPRPNGSYFGHRPGAQVFPPLAPPKIDQALADNDLRKSLEQIDVADEVRAIVTGRSTPPRKKWLEKIFS